MSGGDSNPHSNIANFQATGTVHTQCVVDVETRTGLCNYFPRFVNSQFFICFILQIQNFSAIVMVSHQSFEDDKRACFGVGQALFETIGVNGRGRQAERPPMRYDNSSVQKFTHDSTTCHGRHEDYFVIFTQRVLPGSELIVDCRLEQFAVQ